MKRVFGSIAMCARFVVVLIILAQILMVSVSRHIHVVDSRLESHTHPYASDTHTHSTVDWAHLRSHVTLNYIDSVFHFELNVFLFLVGVIAVCAPMAYRQRYFIFSQLRAPPAL